MLIFMKRSHPGLLTPPRRAGSMSGNPVFSALCLKYLIVQKGARAKDAGMRSPEIVENSVQEMYIYGEDFHSFQGMPDT